jgi:hypothetical protein
VAGAEGSGLVGPGSKVEVGPFVNAFMAEAPVVLDIGRAQMLLKQLFEVRVTVRVRVRFYISVIDPSHNSNPNPNPNSNPNPNHTDGDEC